jgi:rubrerythrin
MRDCSWVREISIRGKASRRPPYAARVLTRRTAIWTGGSALLLAGCGGRPARRLAGSPADLPILGAALEIERSQIALYEAGSRLVSGREGALVQTILTQEHSHAEAIAEAIRELGGRPAAPRTAAAYGSHIPHGAAAWRRHAIQSEQGWTAAYAAAIPRLVNLRLRATFGAMMTVEAEHAVALDVG